MRFEQHQAPCVPYVAFCCKGHHQRALRMRVFMCFVLLILHLLPSQVKRKTVALPDCL